MRSLATILAFTTLGAVTAQDFLSTVGDEPVAPKWTNATVPFDVNLSCETCIRGGYDYCIFRTFPDKVTHGQFRNCTSYPITPQIHSESTVAEVDRWVCSGAFLDEVNAVVNTCGAANSDSRSSQCGDYTIDLNGKRRSYTKAINKLPLWSSCTYRVHTKCGYPGMIYNSESDITGEFDIAYAYYDNVGLDTDINTWDFNATSTFSGSFTSDKVNTNLTVPGTVEHSQYEDCSTSDRNLYLTITRVKNNNVVIEEPVVPENGNQTEEQESQQRLLQTKGGDLSNIYITFITSGAMLAQAMTLLVSAVALLSFAF